MVTKYNSFTVNKWIFYSFSKYPVSKKTFRYVKIAHVLPFYDVKEQSVAEW